MHSHDPTGDSNTETDQASRHEEERRWLLALAAGGPPADSALKALYQRYHGPFRIHMRRRNFSEADTEEALQRVWIEIVRKASTFRSAGIPEAWLWGYLKNVVRDELREFARHASHRAAWVTGDEADIEAAQQQAAGQAADADGPERSRSARDLKDCVQRAFAAFKAEHPVVAWWFYMRHVEDWTPQDMAQYRQSTVGAANQFLSRHRKSFRKYLAPCLPLLPA